MMMRKLIKSYTMAPRQGIKLGAPLLVAMLVVAGATGLARADLEPIQSVGVELPEGWFDEPNPNDGGACCNPFNGRPKVFEITVGGTTFEEDGLGHGVSVGDGGLDVGNGNEQIEIHETVGLEPPDPLAGVLDDLFTHVNIFNLDPWVTTFDDPELFPKGGFVDSNGPDEADFFLFESSGNDDVDGVHATYSIDGGPQLEGQGMAIPSSEWSIPSVSNEDGSIEIAYLFQDLAGVAWHTSDLLDINGNPLPLNAVIHSLRFDLGDLDAMIFTVAVSAFSSVVTVEETDDETVVREEGETTDSFTVALAAEPTAEVTVTIDPPTDDVSLNGQAPNDAITLTFTTADWNVPQTVTVKANDDSEAEGQETQPIDLSTSSTDEDFDAVKGSVSVTVHDNDAASVIIEISDNSTNVGEGPGGATDTYTVELEFAPVGGDVTISIDDEGDPNQATVNDAEPPVALLTFTDANWETPQTVTVGAIDDADVEANPHGTTLSHRASGGGYDGVQINSVAVTIQENDCGAGPFAITDVAGPDGVPDCVVDILDAIAFALQYLDCSIGLCQ